MTRVKDFLYLDSDLVNSIFSQYYKGIITNLSKSDSNNDETQAKIGFDLKLVKGNIGSKSGGSTSQSETIDLHHYAYEMLEDALIENGTIDGAKHDITMLTGNLRIIDASKTILSFAGLKTLLSGFDAAMKLSPNSSSTNAIPQEVRGIVQKSSDISKLLEQLTNNGVFADISGERVALDKEFLVSGNSPEFANNGQTFSGNYVLVGLRSSLSIADEATSSDDILLTLTKAFVGFQSFVKVSLIKPIAIYRIVESE